MRLRWRLAQFFEIIWWRRYLAGKETERYLTEKKLYWKRILEGIAATIAVKQGDTIIDMGCGPSGIYIMFPEHDVVAVDPLLDKYENELSVFSRKRYPHATFITQSIETFTTQQKFDQVFCMNAINHVSDIEAGFKALTQLCAASGKIVVTIDAHNHSWLKAIFRVGPGDVLHPHQYDKAEYIAFLDNNGFEVVQEVCLRKQFIFNHYLLVATKKG